MSDSVGANFISRDSAELSEQSYHIRTMDRADLDRAIAWAAAEGWNPGLHDPETFWHTDPHGFFMSYLHGQPIASLSAVRYGQTFGFIGFYIVHPDYRGQGYGLQIWQAGMTYLQGRIIGLDGVIAQQANYQRSGFELAYRNIRYEGVGQIGYMPQPMGNGGRLASLTSSVQPLTVEMIDDLLSYDRDFFPDDRETFMRGWVAQSESYGVCLRISDRLVGYGVVRPCRTGYKIGPLFADTVDGAEAIFLALKQHMDERERERVSRTADSAIAYPFFLDVPEPNAQAMAIAHHYGMKPMFETARMYTPEAPDVPLDRIFGVTTFELG